MPLVVLVPLGFSRPAVPAQRVFALEMEGGGEVRADSMKTPARKLNRFHIAHFCLFLFLFLFSPLPTLLLCAAGRPVASGREQVPKHEDITPFRKYGMTVHFVCVCCSAAQR